MTQTNFGMIGLGRMGANIVRRLAKHEITSVVYDVSPDAVKTLAAEGSIASEIWLTLSPNFQRLALCGSWFQHQLLIQRLLQFLNI